MIILTQEILNKVTDNNAFIVLIRSIAMRANNNQTCFPSLNKIGEDTGLSKPTVIKALNYLEEKGVIQKKKITRTDGGFSSNFYTISTDDIKVAKAVKLDNHESQVVKEFYPPVKEIYKGSKPILHPLVNSVDSNSQEQIELTSKDNSIRKENIKEKKLDLENYILNLNLSKELKESLTGLLESRKSKKTSTTQKAIDLIIEAIQGWYPNNTDKQFKCVNQSIMNGWTRVFELKTEVKTSNYQSNDWRDKRTKYETPDELKGL